MLKPRGHFVVVAGFLFFWIGDDRRETSEVGSRYNFSFCSLRFQKLKSVTPSIRCKRMYRGVDLTERVTSSLSAVALAKDDVFYRSDNEGRKCIEMHH
jgi:hypothetical protein